MNVETYRELVVVLSLCSAAVNLALIPMVYRNRALVGVTALWVTFAAGAAATNGIGIYFRALDHLAESPLNARDLTVLVPTVTFLAAGIVGWRTLGRLTGRKELSLDGRQDSVQPEHD